MWKKRLAYYKKCAYKIVFGAQAEIIDSSGDEVEEKEGACLIDDDSDSE
jgi:hypothetical protein